MALRSKLLDEKVVESAKKMLKEVRNNAYVSKKLIPILIVGNSNRIDCRVA